MNRQRTTPRAIGPRAGRPAAEESAPAAPSWRAPDRFWRSTGAVYCLTV